MTDDLLCLHCQRRPVRQGARGPMGRYCSVACKHRHHYTPKVRTTSLCVHCGQAFTHKLTATYCSRTCGAQARYTRQKAQRLAP